MISVGRAGERDGQGSVEMLFPAQPIQSGKNIKRGWKGFFSYLVAGAQGKTGWNWGRSAQFPEFSQLGSYSFGIKFSDILNMVVKKYAYFKILHPLFRSTVLRRIPRISPVLPQ